ncbi:MAG: TIGR01777 family oxidoreductase, partial [Bacteroidia bacterium]
MKNVLITGASGLIGGQLTQDFKQAGFQVTHLGRKANANASPLVYGWDIAAQKIDQAALLDKQIIVNLAGAPVADKRWTDARKQEIIDSRVKSTELLVREILALETKPAVFIAASAVGYYGMVTTEQIFAEDNAPASDFFGQCCAAWEQALKPLQEAGVRVVILRIGVVLAKDGGALPKLAGPVKAFIGSPLGSGKQWVPWIHLNDLSKMFLFATQNETLNGVY